MADKDPNKLKFNKQELEEYQRLVKLLGKEIDDVTFEKLTKSQDEAKKYLEDLRTDAKEFTRDISYAASGFKEIANQISKTRSNLKDSTSQFNQLQKIAQQVLYFQQGSSDLTQKDIEKLKEQTKQVKSRMQITQGLLADEIALLQNKNNKTDEELNKLAKSKAAYAENASVLAKESVLYEGLIASLDDVNRQLLRQNKLVGATGVLAEGLKTVFGTLGIGGLSNFLGIDSALKNIQDKAKDVVKSEERLKEIQVEEKQLNENHLNSLQQYESALNNIGNTLAKNKAEQQEIAEKLLSNSDMTEKESISLSEQLNSLKEKEVRLNNQVDNLQKSKQETIEAYSVAKKALEIDKKRNVEISQSASKFSLMKDFLKEMGKNVVKSFMDPLFGLSTVVGMLKDGFLSLNKSQTEFAREAGHTVKYWDTITDSITTSSDYIKIAGALTKQMGMDATTIFSKGTLTEAAELEQLMGLSAEEAGTLAMMAKLSGKELKNQNTEIFKSVANFNKLNKTTIGGKAILQDISKMSSTMTVNFKGNTTAMVEATAAAKKFGLELSQIDKIADSLLNFESSISAELEAELLTGKEFNLERARFLSLNNDIEGLTKEIVNNEQIRVAFASGNRLQQENVAKMLGMQKDEIAKMIIMDAQRQGLSDEAIARAAGMTEEDYKRLSVQDAINKSIEKMSEAMAGPLQALAELVSKGDTLKGIFKAILAIMGGIAVIKIAGLVTQLTSAAVAAGSMAASAAAWASGITLGLGLVAVGAGIAYIMSEMNNAAESAKAKATTNVGDMFSSKGATMVSTAEGGLFKTSPNDEMIVAPGISRMLGSKTPAPQDNSALIAEIRALRSEMSQKKQNIVVNVENKPVVGTQQIVAGLREQYRIE